MRLLLWLPTDGVLCGERGRCTVRCTLPVRRLPHAPTPTAVWRWRERQLDNVQAGPVAEHCGDGAGRRPRLLHHRCRNGRRQLAVHLRRQGDRVGRPRGGLCQLLLLGLLHHRPCLGGCPFLICIPRWPHAECHPHRLHRHHAAHLWGAIHAWMVAGHGYSMPHRLGQLHWVCKRAVHAGALRARHWLHQWRVWHGCGRCLHGWAHHSGHAGQIHRLGVHCDGVRGCHLLLPALPHHPDSCHTGQQAAGPVHGGGGQRARRGAAALDRCRDSPPAPHGKPAWPAHDGTVHRGQLAPRRH
mmetsp:Transcript_18139/g.50825  ORF Transcript_18139/g.50825 Transcript_18139/m.50825 type:complete len:299 (-) Transcript_18139:509-1405(-)